MNILSWILCCVVFFLTGCMSLPVGSPVSPDVPSAIASDAEGMMKLYVYKGGVAEVNSVRDGYFVMFSPVEKTISDTADNKKPVIIYRD